MGLTEDWETELGGLAIHAAVNHEEEEGFSPLGPFQATDENFTKLLTELDGVLHFVRQICVAVDALAEKANGDATT